MRKRILRILLAFFAVLFVAGAAATWFLSDIPFGRLFDAVLLVTVAGLACSLAAGAAIMFRADSMFVRILGAVPSVIAVAVVSLTVILRVDYRMIPGTCYRSGVTTEEWKEDLKYFSEKFPEMHPRLFEMVEREAFLSRVSELEKKMPGLDENSVRTEFYKLLALPADAHSFPNIYSHKIDWHVLPFVFWHFDSGVMVIDSGRDHRETIGTFLVKVGDIPIEQVYERLRPCLAAENEEGWKVRFLHALGISEWLESEGIVSDRRMVRLTFERKDGSRFTRDISPVHFIPVIYWSSLRKIDNTLPYIYSNDREDSYWFEYLPETGSLYLQFNACVRESGGESILEFVDRLGRWVEEHDFERFVIDIRKNDGGDSYVSKVLADLIIGNERIDRRGRLFALTSRKTFSAAVMFLSLLESNSRAVIVGEPTGQGPFFCGAPRTVALPNSGLEFLVSSHYNRCALVDDLSNRVEPDVYVRYTAEDHLNGRDPVIEAVLSYLPGELETDPPDPEKATTDTVGSEMAVELAGRYIFSPYQVLTVEKSGNTLRFTVSDFLEDSFRNVSSDLYPAGSGRFLTEIRGVEMLFVSGKDVDFDAPRDRTGTVSSGKRESGVILNWRGIESFCLEAPPGYRLPMELISVGEIEEGADALYDNKDLYLTEFPGLEIRLNRIGYTLLNEKSLDPAIRIFKLNVALFPESSNTYDSLGEGYLHSGDMQRAEENYRRSLELDPGNVNAREVIRQIEKGRRYDRDAGKWIE